jgi:hypothetical protein
MRIPKSGLSKKWLMTHKIKTIKKLLIHLSALLIKSLRLNQSQQLSLKRSKTHPNSKL